MKTFVITFKDRDKYEDVILQASSYQPLEGFMHFITFLNNGEYSSVNYNASEVFKIEERAG